METTWHAFRCSCAPSSLNRVLSKALVFALIFCPASQNNSVRFLKAGRAIWNDTGAILLKARFDL
jgi:hypothetical protein